MKKVKLSNIKSKYILKNIFEYIKIHNLDFKLFTYSKLLQKKLDYSLIDYQRLFFNKKGIYLKNYLSSYQVKYPYGYDDYFNENSLSELLKEDLEINNINMKLYQQYATEFLNKLDNNKDDNKGYKNYKIIDIYSPIFDSICKINYFKNFYIPISMNFIKKYNVENDYINIFKKLNQSNSNYQSLFVDFNNEIDFDYLKKFGIKFEQIKNLKLFQINSSVNYEYFLKSLFSLKNIENNLLKLTIFLEDINTFKIEVNLFEKLNQFKSLNFLKLGNFKFSNKFILRLNNLKKLYLFKCEEIIIHEDSCISLNELILIKSKIYNGNTLLQLPQLETLDLSNDNHIKNNSIIDFSSLEKLVYLTCEINDFLLLKCSCLKKAILKSKDNYSELIERKTLEKLISIKSLKKIDISFFKINNNEIIKICGENKSINSVILRWKCLNINFNEIILNNVCTAFPKISDLSIYLPLLKDGKLKIIENNNCDIDKISIYGVAKDINFYCKSYKNLKSIYINTYNSKILNNNILPIFNKKCNIIFASLISFHFITTRKNIIKVNTLINLSKNFVYMPALKNFELKCIIENIELDKFLKFIEKVLSLNLKYIDIDIKREALILDCQFTMNELRKLNPDFNYMNMEKIKIQKLY